MIISRETQKMADKSGWLLLGNQVYSMNEKIIYRNPSVKIIKRSAN